MNSAIGETEREAAIAELLRSGCSCVICNASGLHSFYRRGVADLYELLMTRPAELAGAFVADKVVGKGAAALMAAGGVAQVWTGVISLGALELFGKAGVEVEYGEAAFYGPKLDFMVKDALGRRWQLGTIQVDYNLPERFKLEYTGEDNQKHRPVMIHRAPFGSMERFCAVLIEHTAGHFPLWLTPDQVAILPISEKFNDYAQKLCAYFDEQDVRAVVDDRNEKIGRKIRDNEMKRIPYMLIVGEKEAADGTVSVRKQGEGDQGSMKFEDFAKKINEEVRSMINKY